MAFTPDESSTGLPPTVAAGLAAAIPVFGVLYFWIAERNSKFVKLYWMQSLRILGIIFFGTIFLVLSWVMELVTKDNPLTMVCTAIYAVIYLAYFVMLIILAVNAFSGKVYILPVFGAGLKKKFGIE